MSDTKLSARAQSIVADTVLSCEDEITRRQMARELCIYALATVVTLEGDEAACEFAYRAADAAVGAK